MTAHNAINASTQIRQSESNWFGRGMLSVVGGSRLRAAPEFIVGGFIIRECGDGAGSTPPPHNLVGGDSGGNTAARYFAVNLKNSRHRVSPGKSLRLLVAALFHPLAQRRIKQHALQSSANLKHVF